MHPGVFLKNYLKVHLTKKRVFISAGVACFLFLLLLIMIISKSQDNLRQKPDTGSPQVLPASISPTEPYGVNDWNWIDDSMQGMQEMGAKWMRVMVNWKRIEEVQGQPEWNSEVNSLIDFYINQSQKYGLKVSVVPFNAPDWAKQAGGLNLPQPNLYANFITTLLNRYPGKISAVEVLNEENTGVCWPNTRCRDAAFYVPALQAAYQAVKAVDPNITVTTAGLWSSPVGYLEDIYALGAKNYFDVLNFHYYSGASSPALNYNWLISHYRKVMEKYGDGGKPIWLTEFGWTNSEERDRGNIVTTQEQSNNMTYVLDNSRKSGFVTKVFWYVLRDDDGMALMHATNNYGWQTLQPPLVSAIGSGDATLTVSGNWTTKRPSYGTLIADSEQITYTSSATTPENNTLVSGLGRGANGTIAASHAAGIRVYNQEQTANFKKPIYYTYKNFTQTYPAWSASDIVPLPNVPLPASSALSIANPGFESGATGWESSFSVDNTQVHSGASSAKVVNTTGMTVRGNQDSIAVESGKSYFLKAWVKIDPAGSGDMNAMVTLDLRNSGGQYLTNAPGNYYIHTTNGDWREVHYPFTTTADTTQIQIFLSTSGGTGTAWFDDITIEPYDLNQPASLLVSAPTPTPTPTPGSSNNPAADNSPTPTPTGSGSPAPAGGLPGSSPVGTTPPAGAGAITASETVTPIPDQALEPANNASGSDNSGWFQPISAQEIQNLISSLTTSESTSSAATSQDLGKTLAVVGAITAVAILMGIFTFVVIP